MNIDFPDSLSVKYPFLESEVALNDFVERWRRGTLPKPAWTHAAHVAIAAYFVFDRPPDEALEILRSGIVHFNTCVGTPNTEDSGYHETLTRFWLGIVDEFVANGPFATRWEAARGAAQRFGDDRNHYSLYYSFDVVRDRVARREWVAPDRMPATADAASGRES